MSREKLRAGSITVDAVAHEDLPTVAYFMAEGPHRDYHVEASADAAQLNAALAVVERAEKILANAGRNINTHGVMFTGAYDVLRLILEPDSAVRATMPGASWLGDGGGK
jgi:hypothetical protein